MSRWWPDGRLGTPVGHCPSLPCPTVQPSERLTTLGIMRDPLKPVEHQDTMVLRGIREAINWAPMLGDHLRWPTQNIQPGTDGRKDMHWRLQGGKVWHPMSLTAWNINPPPLPLPTPPFLGYKQSKLHSITFFSKIMKICLLNNELKYIRINIFVNGRIHKFYF